MIYTEDSDITDIDFEDYYFYYRNQLSEAFIEIHLDKVNWEYLSDYQKLSESFMEKYQDKLDWLHVSYSQKLSESFIEKFKDKLEWYHISSQQNLSDVFIKKHYEKLYLALLLKNDFLKKSTLLQKIRMLK